MNARALVTWTLRLFDTGTVQELEKERRKGGYGCGIFQIEEGSILAEQVKPRVK